MGIYETLYAFQDAFGTHMGEGGTHPWSQGFPLTIQLPNGPEMPTNVHLNAEDLKYPKAWGLPELRKAIAGIKSATERCCRWRQKRGCVEK